MPSSMLASWRARCVTALGLAVITIMLLAMPAAQAGTVVRSDQKHTVDTGGAISGRALNMVQSVTAGMNGQVVEIHLWLAGAEQFNEGDQIQLEFVTLGEPQPVNGRRTVTPLDPRILSDGVPLSSLTSGAYQQVRFTFPTGLDVTTGQQFAFRLLVPIVNTRIAIKTNTNYGGGQAYVHYDEAAQWAQPFDDDRDYLFETFVAEVDNTAPEVDLRISLDDTVSSSSWYNLASSGSDGVLIVYDATDNSGVAAVTCQNNDNLLFTTNDIVGTFTVLDGEHNISCTATDIADPPNTSIAATLSLKVDQTPPAILGSTTPDANSAGWNNTSVTVSFTCTDDGSGKNVDTVQGTTITDEVANQSVSNTGECTDVAGNTAQSVAVTGINIDKTPPVITASRTPANANGWNNGPVTISYTCTDVGSVQSGIASDPISEDVVAGEGENQSITSNASCVDAAGNSASQVTTSNINVDRTDPVLTASRTPANAGGWNNGAVTITYTCTDQGTVQSGIASGPISPDVVSTEGTNQSVTSDVDCVDRAGNAAEQITTSGINIDMTGPDINIPANMTVDATSSTGATVTYGPVTATDTLSQVASVNCSPASGTSFGLGQTTVTCTAADVAGNQSQNWFTVTVLSGSQQWAALKQEISTARIPLVAKLQLSRITLVGDIMIRLNSRLGVCSTLSMFNLQVKMLSPRYIPTTTANAWIADANQIRKTFGC